MNFWQENKVKIFNIVLWLLLVVASFGVGYLVAKDNNRAPIIIEQH
ncbi:MAG: hypothetical protein Q8Q37_01145 [bacterium]|nr:hypothetical protein [bacterium]